MIDWPNLIVVYLIGLVPTMTADRSETRATALGPGGKGRVEGTGSTMPTNA